MLIADDGVDPDGIVACQTLQANASVPWIRYFAQVDSTNTAALRDLHTLEPSLLPRLYVADCQNAGRGRHGRTWVADEGTLTFSLVIPKTVTDAEYPQTTFTRPAPFSIAAGVGVARTIDHLAAPYSSRIKWPNDIYCDDGKVAGILIESAPPPHDLLVIGIGINVATDLRPSLNAFESPAKSISEFTQRYPRRYQWLEEVVEQVLGAIDEVRRSPQSIIHEQRRRCMLTGQPVRYLVGDQWHHAMCEGVDTDGSLLIRDASGTKRLSSGEVQRVRRSS